MRSPPLAAVAFLRCIAVGLAALVLGGCVSLASSGLLERDRSNANLSSRQLNLLVADFAHDFASIVAAAADQIGTKTREPQALRTALRWKIRSVQEANAALSHQDPLLCLMDLWVLAIQQRALLAGPEGERAFGAQQQTAAAAAGELESRLRAIAHRTLKNPAARQKMESFVAGFAAKFPLRGTVETNLVLMRAALGRLPETARWQAELVLLEAEEFPLLGRVSATLGGAEQALRGVDQLTAGLLALLPPDRSALLETVEGQRRDLFKELDALRRNAFQDWERERTIVLQAVQLERTALMGAVRLETEQVLGALQRERTALLAEIDATSIRLIDHLAVRIAQLGAGALVLGGIGVLVFRRVGRPGP